jgi:G3E family GTPase
MILPDSIIPITILTGFLGSGKTTLLKHWLKSPELGESAVLINEFGSVGLDHLMLGSMDEDVLVLDNGCLCCAVREDMIEAILKLFKRRASGEISSFNRLIIETSGLSEPAPIIKSLISNPIISQYFQLENVVTVIDAKNGLSALKSYNESYLQLLHADLILISKVDLVSLVQLKSIKKKISEVNPNTPIYTTEEIKNLTKKNILSQYQKSIKIINPDYSHYHDRYTTLSFCYNKPINPLNLNNWINTLIQSLGNRLLRVKGILNIIDEPKRMFIHAIQHTIHPPSYGAEWLEELRTSKIVVIAVDTKIEEIKKTFDALKK